MTEPTPPTLDMALTEVAAWVAARNHEQALARLDELNTVYLDAVRILRARAQVHELSGNYPKAIDDYSRALQILPADAQLMTGLARCQVKAEQPREAGLIAQQALAYEPRDADALKIAADMEEGPVARGLIAVARSWFRAGLVNRALSEMRRVNLAEPDRTDLQVVLAEMIWRNGLKVTTVELCQAILDEEPDCLNAHVILSELWAQMGNRDIATVHARAVERLDPDHRATREWLGDASPLAIADVPAVPELPQPPEPESPQTEDTDGELDRSAWVEELIAATGPVTAPNVAGAPQLGGEKDGEQVEDVTPLEWTPAVTDDVTAEDMPAWLNTLKLQPVQPASPQGVEIGDLDLPAELSTPPADDARVVSVTRWSPGAPRRAKKDQAADAAIVTLPAPVEPAEAATPALPAPVEPDEPASIPSATAPVPEPSAPAAGEPVAMAEEPPPAAPAAGEPDQTVASAAEAAPATRKRISRRRTDRAKPAKIDVLAQARQALEAGQYEQALEHYGSLIAADSELDTVLADLDTITHAHPELRSFHKLLGNLYERMGEVKAALMAYHRALE